MAEVNFLLEGSPRHHKFLKIFNSLGVEGDVFSFDYTSVESQLKSSLKDVYLRCTKLLAMYDLNVSDVILVRANGGQDGHAITLDQEVVTFLDLVAYMTHWNNKNFDYFSHLLHEMLHASHYKCNPAFDPLSLRNSKYILGVKSAIEGISVYCCRKLNPLMDNYWFGLLGNEELNMWIDTCEKNFSKDIEAIKTNNYSKNQELNLLGVKSKSAEDLISGRRAYYQISKALEQANVEMALHT